MAKVHTRTWGKSTANYIRIANYGGERKTIFSKNLGEKYISYTKYNFAFGHVSPSILV